jgi:hypothetical protein
MSQSFDSDDDQDINIEVDLSAVIESLLTNPSFIQEVAVLVRNQIVGPMARRMGNTADKTAQRKKPLASKPQVPGTKRVN